MIVFKNFMFVPIPTKSSKSKTAKSTTEAGKTAEETSPPKVSPKEWLTVIFVYLLMISMVGLLLAYVRMVYLRHPGANAILDLFKIVIAALVGYFFGTHKERAPQ